MTDDELVPISVRLGEVVPPEDPEDWTRPLTWLAAFGMLAGPLAVFAWFIVSPPTAAVDQTAPAAPIAAAVLAAGAAIVGATQIGWARTWTATVAAALFSALVVVAAGAALAGERQVAVASPTVSHAVAAAIGGLAGAILAAAVSIPLVRLHSRLARAIPAVAVGAAVAGITVCGGLRLTGPTPLQAG